MDPFTIGILTICGMLLLIALQWPIGVAIGIAGLVGFAMIRDWHSAVTLFGTESASVMGSADLAVIPLFLLMGSFASAAGLSADVFRLAYAFVGQYRGGLAMAVVGGCAGFGSVCGSSMATAATMTRIALPEMLRRGYDPRLAAGSIASGGTLGMIIPPSVVMIIYAFLTEQFVITLFIAAIVPGIITVLMYWLTIFAYARLRPGTGPAGPRMTWRERATIVRQSWAIIVLAAVVGGGIYSGIFTVPEAAAIGTICAFAFTYLRGRLSWRVLREVLLETGTQAGMIYLIIIGSHIFTYSITLSGVPEALVKGISAMDVAPVYVIFALTVMYLVLGCIFESVGAMVLTLPFVFPLVLALGYDPVWWGVINIMIIEIGMITPPVGLNVFVLHGMANAIALPKTTKPIGLSTIFAGVTPFIAIDLIKLTILILFPSLTLWLVTVMGKAG